MSNDTADRDIRCRNYLGRFNGGRYLEMAGGRLRASGAARGPFSDKEIPR